MPNDYLLDNPLWQQLNSILGTRMMGQGVGLNPADLQAQLAQTNQTIQGNAQRESQQALQNMIGMGIGRSGYSGNVLGGIQQNAGQQMQRAQTEQSLQQEQMRQLAIHQALQQALQFGQIGSNYSLGQSELAEKQREYDQNMYQQTHPGLLSLLGAGAGAAANLFGPLGAFPNFFGLLGGRGQGGNSGAPSASNGWGIGQMPMGQMPSGNPWGLPPAYGTPYGMGGY